MQLINLTPSQHFELDISASKTREMNHFQQQDSQTFDSIQIKYLEFTILQKNIQEMNNFKEDFIEIFI